MGSKTVKNNGKRINICCGADKNKNLLSYHLLLLKNNSVMFNQKTYLYSLKDIKTQSTFLSKKFIDYFNAHARAHTRSLSSQSASAAFLWLLHTLFIWSFAPFLPSFFVSAPADLNCNNIVNWGYREWRSQADRQPRFPALAAPHHSGRDTWLLNPHLAVAHLVCLLSCVTAALGPMLSHLTLIWGVGMAIKMFPCVINKPPSTHHGLGTKILIPQKSTQYVHLRAAGCSFFWRTFFNGEMLKCTAGIKHFWLKAPKKIPWSPRFR